MKIVVELNDIERAMIYTALRNEEAALKHATEKQRNQLKKEEVEERYAYINHYDNLAEGIALIGDTIETLKRLEVKAQQ